MGQFKDVGNPAIALMEEMAEAIQVIAKKERFSGDWNEIPEGKELSRWDELRGEMDDIIYQWNRLIEERYKKEHDCEQFPYYLWSAMLCANGDIPTAEDNWDGDNASSE